MDLEAVENDIITRLKAQLNSPQPEIRSWPDNPRDYQVLDPQGAVLVRYLASNYQDPEANDEKTLVQERRIEYAVDCAQKSLKRTKAHQGVYDLIEQVRQALSGYTPNSLADASIMWPGSDRWVQERGGIWLYTTTWVFTFPESEV